MRQAEAARTAARAVSEVRGLSVEEFVRAVWQQMNERGEPASVAARALVAGGAIAQLSPEAVAELVAVGAAHRAGVRDNTIRREVAGTTHMASKHWRKSFVGVPLKEKARTVLDSLMFYVENGSRKSLLHFAVEDWRFWRDQQRVLVTATGHRIELADRALGLLGEHKAATVECLPRLAQDELSTLAMRAWGR